MVSRATAHWITAEDELNRERTGRWTEAIDYATGRVLVFDNRGLSADSTARYHQLHWSEYMGKSIKRRGKIYRPAKGFKLGRLARGSRSASAIASKPAAKSTKRGRRGPKPRLRVAG